MAPEELTDQPYVSIVVLTLNSETTVKECLDSIFMLDYPRQNFEVVIVDNGSSDSTLRIIGDYDVKHYIKSEAGISELRNFGAAISSGEIIGFIDSDCIVASSWLRNGLRHLSDDNVALAGCDYSARNNASWIEKAWCAKNSDKIISNINIPAGNMILSKRAFNEIGGFDPGLITGEDSDLCIRLMEENYRIISDPSIMNIHLGGPRTLLQVLKKQIWHGKGLVRVLRKREFHDKVYLATNIFLILHLWLLIFLISPLPLRVRVPGLLCILLAIVCILILASLNNALRSGTFRYLPHLIPIFYSYFIGRSIALVKIYFDLLGKRIKTIGKTRSRNTEEADS